MIPGGGDKVVVLPLKGGGKVVVPIVTPSVGDKCVTIPLHGGGKVVTKLWIPSSGEKVIVMPLQGGGKVCIPLSATMVYTDIYIQQNVGDLIHGGDSVSYQFKLRRNSVSTSEVSYPPYCIVQIYPIGYSGDVVNAIELYDDDITDDWVTYTSGYYTITSGSYPAWVRVFNAPGLWVDYTDIKYSINGGEYTLFPDGDFSSGEYTTWQKYITTGSVDFLSFYTDDGITMQRSIHP